MSINSINSILWLSYKESQDVINLQVPQKSPQLYPSQNSDQ